VRDFLDTVTALRRERQSFATATVVGRRPPVSAHLGDRAIIYADGRMEGFVGGACSREIVRKHALECIRARHPRLVSIRPDAAAASTSDPEHVVVPMTCVSEGAVDVYVEPSVRPRRLVVVGTTPVADALTRIALALDYEVVRVVDASEQRDLEHPSASFGFTVAPLESLDEVLKEVAGDAAAVVASQGHYDEQALETILRSGAAYVGLVASRKRGATVKQWLEANGVPGVGDLRNPAGLDLGARTAPEVALSILAEIVQRQPDQTLQAWGCGPSAAAPAEAPASTAIDPVCNMEVEIATARHTAEVGGTTYYFCCAQCRTRFLQDPASFPASGS
jgi:xanthine dehydrogenase accessory factor